MQPGAPPIVALLFLVSCSATPPASTASSNEQLDEFASIDTSRAGVSVGCGGNHLFKLLNDSCVLVIHTPHHFVDGIPVDVDKLYSTACADLYLFARDSANLMNICTDVFISNAPRPIATLHAISGRLLFKRHVPVEVYGNDCPVTSVIVRHLFFRDPEGEHELDISNELLWRVVDLGTPG